MQGLGAGQLQDGGVSSAPGSRQTGTDDGSGGAKGQRGCCDADHGWRGAVAVATAGEGSSLAPADMAREQTTVRQPLGRAAWLGEREKRGSTPGRGRSRLGRLGFGHGGRC